MANDWVDPHPYYWAQASGLPTTTAGWGGGGTLPSHLSGQSFAEVVHPFYRQLPELSGMNAPAFAGFQGMDNWEEVGGYDHVEGVEGIFGGAPSYQGLTFDDLGLSPEMEETMIDLGMVDSNTGLVNLDMLNIPTALGPSGGQHYSGMTQEEFYNLSPEERYAVSDQITWTDPGAALSYEEMYDPAKFQDLVKSIEGGGGGDYNDFIKLSNMKNNLFYESPPPGWNVMPVAGTPEGFDEKKAFEGTETGIPTFGKGWYEPAFMANVELPTAETIGSPYSVGNIRTGDEHRQYETLTEAGIGPGTDIFQKFFEPISEGFADITETSKLPWHTGGSAEGIIPKGAVYDTKFGTLQSELEGIESGYGTALGDIDIAEERAMEDFDKRIENIEDLEVEAGLTKAEQLLGAKVDRTKAVRGRKKEYEAARAPQATFGGAYSGPAAQVAKDVSAANIRELGDIKRDELKSIKDYDLTMEEFSGQREDIEGEGGEREQATYDFEYGPEGRQQLLSDATSAYDLKLEGLGNIIGNTILPDILDIANLPSTYATSWQEFGEQHQGGQSKTFNPRIAGGQWGGGGYMGGPYFSETTAPQMQLAGQIGSEATAWNERLASLLPTLMGSLNPFNQMQMTVGAGNWGPYNPDDTTGG